MVLDRLPVQGRGEVPTSSRDLEAEDRSSAPI